MRIREVKNKVKNKIPVPILFRSETEMLVKVYPINPPSKSLLKIPNRDKSDELDIINRIVPKIFAGDVKRVFENKNLIPRTPNKNGKM